MGVWDKEKKIYNERWCQRNRSAGYKIKKNPSIIKHPFNINCLRTFDALGLHKIKLINISQALYRNHWHWEIAALIPSIRGGNKDSISWFKMLSTVYLSFGFTSSCLYSGRMNYNSFLPSKSYVDEFIDRI